MKNKHTKRMNKKSTNLLAEASKKSPEPALDNIVKDEQAPNNEKVPTLGASGL
jgi:hypothetical protein